MASEQVERRKKNLAACEHAIIIRVQYTAVTSHTHAHKSQQQQWQIKQPRSSQLTTWLRLKIFTCFFFRFVSLAWAFSIQQQQQQQKFSVSQPCREQLLHTYNFSDGIKWIQKHTCTAFCWFFNYIFPCDDTSLYAFEGNLFVCFVFIYKTNLKKVC